MRKIKAKSCKDLDVLLKRRLMIFFNIFRADEKKVLEYHFEEPLADRHDAPRDDQDAKEA